SDPARTGAPFTSEVTWTKREAGTSISGEEADGTGRCTRKAPPVPVIAWPRWLPSNSSVPRTEGVMPPPSTWTRVTRVSDGPPYQIPPGRSAGDVDAAAPLGFAAAAAPSPAPGFAP